ncbi:hypothetical protein SDC9_212924 [bioreactor metagenome]|uniref:Uncharacterized protein n=1 Tax=bioreactor metagenome TaxID=1076179 RepID=A0A645JNB2_9ZZZZ
MCGGGGAGGIDADSAGSSQRNRAGEQRAVCCGDVVNQQDGLATHSG